MGKKDILIKYENYTFTYDYIEFWLFSKRKIKYDDILLVKVRLKYYFFNIPIIHPGGTRYQIKLYLKNNSRVNLSVGWISKVYLDQILLIIKKANPNVKIEKPHDF